MSKRFIDTELWDKSEFNNCTPVMKLLTIFITCKCDSIGIFKMAPMLINAYIGENIQEKDILSIPCDIEKISNNCYWLTKFCDFQYGELKEECRPHRKYIQLLKSHKLYERVLKGYSKGIETLEEQEQEKDKEKDKDKKGVVRGKNFIPPTLQDVASYCLERNNGVDSTKWHDFYSAKGWMVGSNKMKDWKAAVRTWETKKTVNKPINTLPATIDYSGGF